MELNQCHSLDFGLDIFQESEVEIPAELYPFKDTEFEEEVSLIIIYIDDETITINTINMYI